MAPPILAFVDVNISLVGASPDKFSFGALLGVFEHTVTGNRQDGPFFSVPELVDAGFTSIATPAIYDWGSIVLTQDRGVDRVLIGREDAADANLTATLDAIEGAGSDAWYITNVPEYRDDPNILLASAWVESREKILIVQTASANLLAGVALNIGEQLQTLNYHRTALIYHASDARYLDGAWSSRCGGFDLDSPAGAGNWIYKELQGVPFDPVTGAQATNIWGVNANLYGRTKGLSFTSKGTMASGRPIDVTTSLDWVKVRVEENVLARFVGNPTKVPYSNAGITDIVGAIGETLDAGVRNGHVSPDVDFQIIAPDATELSAQIKAARELTIQAVFVLAGAIEKVILNVNVSF